MADRALRPRRTRQELTADSRSLILDAAVECLAEEGYAATTTLRIQARAGVSRGRLLHHFPVRDALLVAAAQHLATSRMVDMERLAAESDLSHADPPTRLRRAIDVMWEQFRQPYFWAAMELWAAARTHDGLREELRPVEYRLGRASFHAIDALFGPQLRAHPNFAVARDLLFTSMRGVALSYAFVEANPADDRHVALWIDLAARLLDVECGT
ncbi:MAG: TetR/AcrR family transcriptional regulator [Sporichthyaceae bacterium]